MLNFYINHGGFFQFDIIINVLSALSDSFEYICYGSTAITNIFYSTARGLSRQNLTSVDVRF